MKFPRCFPGIAVFAVLSASPVLEAADFVVTVTTDDASTPPADSLRAAIVAANANDEADTITFAGDVIASPFILLDGAALPITDTDGSVVIDASALSEMLVISGDSFTSPSRVFEVGAGAELELRNIEVTDGQAPDGMSGTSGNVPTAGDPGANGGGILNLGILTLRDCAVVFNFAGNGGKGGENSGGEADSGAPGGAGGRGGGIHSTGDNAELYLYDTVVASNEAGDGGAGGDVAAADIGDPGSGGTGGDGGGVSSELGLLHVERSTIESNSAGTGGLGGFDGDGGTGAAGGDGGNGGGIYSDLAAIRVVDSTIAQNNAGDGGLGGEKDMVVDTEGAGGNGGNGGGLYVSNFATSPSEHVSGSLVWNNNAGNGAIGGDAPPGGSDDGTRGGDGGSGGGIFVASAAVTDSTWSMVNSTVTLNLAGDGADGGDGSTGEAGGDGGDAGKGAGLAFDTDTINDYFAELVHLTIASNFGGFAGNGGAEGMPADGAESEGGGIWESPDEILFGGNGITLANTIVALNDAVTFPDVEAGSFGEEGTNFVGGNPQLDALTDLGGSTQVIPPLPGSPVLDGGGVLGSPLTTDQRGGTRPLNGAPDIGAVEIGFQVDTKIGKSSNPAKQKIDDFYSNSPGSQKQKLKLKEGKKGKAYFSVQNDGEIGESFTVTGTKANKSLKVKVVRLTGGAANVTGAMKAGYATGLIDPGASVVFRVEAKPRSEKRTAKQKLTYRGIGDTGGSRDAVLLDVKQKK